MTDIKNVAFISRDIVLFQYVYFTQAHNLQSNAIRNILSVNATERQSK